MNISLLINKKLAGLESCAALEEFGAKKTPNDLLVMRIQLLENRGILVRLHSSNAKAFFYPSASELVAQTT